MIELWFPKRPNKIFSVFIIEKDGSVPSGYVKTRPVGRVDKSRRGMLGEKIVKRKSLLENYYPSSVLSLTEMAAKYRLDVGQVRQIYGDLCFQPNPGSGLPDELYRKPDKARPVSTVPSASVVTGTSPDLLAEQRKTNALLTQLLAAWQPTTATATEDADALTLL